MNKKIITILAGTVLATWIAITPAHAATLGIGASAVTPVVTTTAKANLSAARLPKIIARSDTEISARLTALNALNTRVQTMKNVSASEKTTIANEIQTNINGLTTLKAKIDADTVVVTATTDEKSIFGSFRIYALVIPQGYIAASADRVATISAMMTAISAKLQTRITADQTAGKNVASMQASLSDLNAKVSDASTQAITAQASVGSLTPDQGNTTELAANTAALKAARANIKTSTQDLVTARADAKSIIQSLKNLGIDASASAS